MGLHMLCMNTNTNTFALTWLEVTEKACPLLAGSQNISSLAFVSVFKDLFPRQGKRSSSTFR